MATSGIQRIKDIAVTSIECGNRLIIDRDANVNVPTLFADSNLTVDIGGSVNLQATTINLRNTVIDFTGASIMGFCGNVCGNTEITFSAIISEPKVIKEMAAQNTAASPAFITADLFTGSLLGDVVSTKVIEEHIIGQGIELIGTLTGDMAGTFNGQHKGDIITSYISHMGHSTDIQLIGTLNGKFTGIFRGDASLGYVIPMDRDEGILLMGDLHIVEGTLSAPNYCVGGKQIVGARLPAISSLPSNASLQQIIQQQEKILDILRTHGLIETT